MGKGGTLLVNSYLQLGNCILKYFNLSNICKYIRGNLAAPSHPYPSASACSFPGLPAIGPQSRERTHQGRSPVRPSQQLGPEADRSAVHQEAWKPAPRLGEGRASCLGRVRCAVALGPSRAFEALGSMACPWPRGDTHCHNTQ